MKIWLGWMEVVEIDFSNYCLNKNEFVTNISLLLALVKMGSLVDFTCQPFLGYLMLN